eukprot:Hpha_TRINITY_DN30979_c0_g1::TRINITY_DN30979_c0_g1_i1::g.112281::m.112281
MSRSEPQSTHRVGGTGVRRCSPSRSPASGPDFAFCHNTLWPIREQEGQNSTPSGRQGTQRSPAQQGYSPAQQGYSQPGHGHVQPLETTPAPQGGHGPPTVSYAQPGQGSPSVSYAQPGQVSPSVSYAQPVHRVHVIQQEPQPQLQPQSVRREARPQGDPTIQCKCEERLAELWGLCDGSHQGLQESVSRLRGEVEALRQSGSGADPQVNALVECAANLQKEIGELRDELRQAADGQASSHELQSVSQQQAAAAASQRDLHEEVRMLQMEVRELRSGSERMEKELEILRKEQQRQQEGDLASVVQELQSRLAAVEAAQKDASTGSNKSQERLAAVEAQQREANGASVKAAASAAALGALGQRVESADSRIADLEKRHGQRLTDLEGKLGQRISVNADLEALEDKVGQIAEDLAALSRKPDAPSSSAPTSDELDMIIKSLESLDEKVIQVHEELEKLKKSQGDIDADEVLAAIDGADRCEVGLSELRKRVEQTDSKMGELSGFAESLAKTLDERIKELRDKNLELDTQLQAEQGKMRRALELATAQHEKNASGGD